MADDKIVRIPKELHERWDAVSNAIRERHEAMFGPDHGRVTSATVIGEMLLSAEDELGLRPRPPGAPPRSAERYLELAQQALDVAQRAEAMARRIDPSLADEADDGDS